MQIILVTLLSLFCISDHAGAAYANGQAVALANQKLMQDEQGFFVKVPVDYQDISKGHTFIYAHFHDKFNPLAPTVIYFIGGPGTHSHKQSDRLILLTKFPVNVLLFDQRGIGFSRPHSEKVWLDPSFYSSENTARDAEEIRKHLSLGQVSVYGQSYGTVPATMYAHLFSASTRSVILEGTPFENIDGSKNSEFLRAMQDYFDSLSSPLKNKLITLSKDPEVGSGWLPRFTRWILGFGGRKMLELYRPGLEEGALLNDQEFKTQLQVAGYLTADTVGDVESVGHGDTIGTGQSDADSNKLVGLENPVNSILMLKEFDVSRAGLGFEVIFEKGTFRWEVFEKDNYFSRRARHLAVPRDPATRYRVAHYPISVPTYYLQGTEDPITPLSGALAHWNTAAQGRAYFLSLIGGGHDLLLFMSSMDEFSLILEKMVVGATIVASDFLVLSQNHDVNFEVKEKRAASFASCDGVLLPKTAP